MIANIDENMGKLEQMLIEQGLRDNTIVIFLTDNGTNYGDEIFNAGMRGKKTSLYEGGHAYLSLSAGPRAACAIPGRSASLRRHRTCCPR